jgi:hypothetical protein
MVPCLRRGAEGGDEVMGATWTAEELVQIAEMFGAEAPGIVLSDEERAAIERHLAFVEEHGRQP